MRRKTGKLISIIILPLLIVFFLIVRSRRSRIIVRNEKGEILLVRGWLGLHEWALPGGGVERGETPLEAAKRELEEEVGITDTELEFLGEKHMGTVAKYRGFLFAAEVKSDYKAKEYRYRQLEILEARWFPVDKLPEHVAKIITPYL
jgi:8-oxo-dGTP pyrophosphatase MutT (NUDIX family)